MKIPKGVVSAFREAGPFLIASHIDPDGDALGSALALGLGLKAAGKKVFLYNRDPVPSYHRYLPGQRLFRHDIRPLAKGDPLIVLLDCNSPERAAAGGYSYRKSVVIDHHETESSFGTVRWVEPAAAATGMMIYYLLKALRIPITPEIATNLYTAIAVDTGTFRYSNTSAEVLRVGAALVEAGAEPNVISEHLYESWEYGRFRLLTMVLNTLEIRGHVALTHITRAMYRKTGTSAEATENFSNIPRIIGSVKISALLREVGSREWKASLRSKGGMNVAKIAERFGGGGHQNAAGFRIKADLESAKKAILREAAKIKIL
ncbi:MAG: bifunctional oligoribonuclease/PAP phosphatase NrnA [Nitrospiraceae bacterium]|nr:bifunctional oligoribonuclease/PAP phosphatase NrnA [Nitrospiraceae bacterium]